MELASTQHHRATRVLSLIADNDTVGSAICSWLDDRRSLNDSKKKVHDMLDHVRMPYGNDELNRKNVPTFFFGEHARRRMPTDYDGLDSKGVAVDKAPRRRRM